MHLRSVVAALALATATVAPAVAQFSWSTYVHPVFGTRIAYPREIFTEIAETPTGVVLRGTEAMLELSVMTAPEIRTAADLRQFLSGGIGYENVTYSPSGETWLVLSGYRADRVFYEKFFIVGASIQGFGIEYPVATRYLYDPMVELLEDSFQPGHG